MKVVIINGSPRKNGNTAALCKSFSDGLSSAKKDISIEYIDLHLAILGMQKLFWLQTHKRRYLWEMYHQR